MSQGFTKAITLDTDGTLAADSDMLVASQKAVKTYVDNSVSGLGAGDVVGPASATDDRIATFDGTSGKLIQDGGYTIAGLLAKSSYILGYVFSVSSTSTTSEQLLLNILIPANTLAVGDMIEIQTYARKTSGAGLIILKWYLNSVNTLGGGGSTQYGLQSTSSVVNQLHAPRIGISGASAQIGYPSGAGVLWGNAVGSTYSAGTLSVASDIYAQVAVTKATAADGYELAFGAVIIHKYRT